MKIVFAGTPEFAAQAMRAIDAAGHQIVLVLTQPDRRSGRGMHVQASPVKTFALEKNIPLLQPASLRRNSVDPEKQAEAEAAYQQLSTTDFDVMVVVAYGLILPQDVLDIAESNLRHGCFNIHASILPRWRGAAPIQRSIEHGDRKTGVSIMKMDAGLDTGDTVLVREIAIADDETSASLHDRLAKLGAESIVEALSTLKQGASLIKTPQAGEDIRYAEKILKSEAEIDWQLSATEIDRRIRAFNPFPGATSNLDGIPIKFWNSRVSHSGDHSQIGQIGEVLGFSKEAAFIQCGQGVIEVLEMQKPGGKRMNAVAYLRAHGAPSKALRFHKE
jgi:methionyl-tRNA formyltransferase